MQVAEGKCKATNLNFSSYYSLAHDDKEIFFCFDLAMNIFASYMQEMVRAKNEERMESLIPRHDSIELRQFFIELRGFFFLH